MNRKQAVVYIHGKGGNAGEAEHYRPLFPDADVIGLEFESAALWDTVEAFPALFAPVFQAYDSVILVANSIGAWYAMMSLSDAPIKQAYFISPIVNMERLILDMAAWAGVTERELREKGSIETNLGETLSWEVLCRTRETPNRWHTPTRILYGAKDYLQSYDTVCDFAEQSGAMLRVMPGGEHWFHTPEQMTFLDAWLTEGRDAPQDL